MIDVIIPKGTLVEVFSDRVWNSQKTNDFYTNFLGRQYITKTRCNTSVRNDLVPLESVSDSYDDVSMFAWRIRPVKRLESESEEL